MDKYGYGDVSAFRDMVDGGGAGRSGESFEGGGILSSIGNAAGGPDRFANVFPGGDDNRQRNSKNTSFLEDMINGGGLGHSGDRFQGGGIYSLLANLFLDPVGSGGSEAASTPDIFSPQDNYAGVPAPGSELPGPVLSDRNMMAAESDFFVPPYQEGPNLPRIQPQPDLVGVTNPDALKWSVAPAPVMPVDAAAPSFQTEMVTDLAQNQAASLHPHQAEFLDWQADRVGSPNYEGMSDADMYRVFTKLKARAAQTNRQLQPFVPPGQLGF